MDAESGRGGAFTLVFDRAPTAQNQINPQKNAKTHPQHVRLGDVKRPEEARLPIPHDGRAGGDAGGGRGTPRLAVAGEVGADLGGHLF